jgi:hypothetical protein
VSLSRATGTRLTAAFSLTLTAALCALALSAVAPASAETCPSFRVLHNDRIGAANLPAGNYEGVADAGLSCQGASQLFTRFLQDWDGDLPKPWRVVAEGSGKAEFVRSGLPGFEVRRIGGGGGGGTHPELGRLCTDRYTVNAGTEVGPLFFAKGQYALYLPPRSAITCRRAAILFTRFLAAPEGRLPFPWRVKTQTATFFKPDHPVRSSFRVDPA